VADPTFLGYFMDKGVDAAAKVVRKVIIGTYHTQFIHLTDFWKVCYVEDNLRGLHLSFGNL